MPIRPLPVARIRFLLVTALIVMLSGTAGFAELTGPRPSDRRVVFVVTKLIEREHYAKPKSEEKSDWLLTDEMSHRLLKSFVESYDPFKLYFSKADMDRFSENKDQLDDLLRSRDLEFPYDVFRTLLSRIEERVKMANEILDNELDFTTEEAFVTEPDDIEFVAEGEEIKNRWRRRIKYDLLQLKADEVDLEEAKKRLRKRYGDYLKRMKQTNDDELVERYLNHVATALDPHSAYFSSSTLENFRIRLGLNYQGIGAELEEKDGMAIIRRIIPGGAAEKAGELKAGDQIVEVGQDTEGEMENVVDMRLDHIIDRIRGPEDTVVRLGVIPKGEKNKKIYSITRAKITLSDNAAKGTVIEHNTKDGMVKVGVIDLPSFYVDMAGANAGNSEYTSTTRDVRKILADFRKQDVKVVLLDLRRNGGGSLQEAISLTGLFIDDGPVVQIKGSDGRVRKYDDLDAGMAWDGPLVVATSRFSASASEILAGAIKDYGRGMIVGDPSTHGKGTVQTLLELPRLLGGAGGNLGALKITIQKFYRPNGASTQQRGVKADIILPSLSTHIAEGEGELENALAFDRVPRAEHDDYSMIDQKLVKSLAEASEARRKTSKDFAALNKSIEEFLNQKDRNMIPLEETQFMARLKESDARREEIEKLQGDRNEEEDEDDFALKEIAAIAGDYYASLNGKTQATPQ